MRRSEFTYWRGWVVLLLALGAGACWALYPQSPRLNPAVPANPAAFETDVLRERILLALAAILSLWPPSRKIILRAIGRLKNSSPRDRRWSILSILVLSGPLLYGLAKARGRVLLPYWHDEEMCRLQTTFFAHGKLCMPALPLPDFFDVPYIICRPVYGSIYFPGTALLHVPGVWLHLPYFIMPLVIASLILALVYSIVSELIDPLAGWLAVILMLSLELFRWLALVEMAHPAGLLCELTAMWAWLRWRQSQGMPQISRSPVVRIFGSDCKSPTPLLRDAEEPDSSTLDPALRRTSEPASAANIQVMKPLANMASGNAKIGAAWLALAGIAAGLYAITRPLDCLTVLLPLGVAWAIDLRRQSMRTIALSAGIFLLAASPFVAFQLAFDRAFTGHLLQTPLSMYYRTVMNIHGVGLEHYDPNFVPPTSSALVRDTYLGIVASRASQFTTAAQAARQWFVQRLPMTFGVALPSLLLIVFFPVGFLGLTNSRRWVFALMFWFYLAGAALVFQFLTHYPIAAAPAAIFMILLGARVVAGAFPARGILPAFIPAAIFFLAMHRICLNAQDAFQELGPSVMRTNDLDIPRWVHRPAVVLFRYSSADGDNAANDEPAYNWNVLWPDDAPIVRALDLGADRDKAIIAYYARIQPEREIYIYDRQAKTLRDLGRAGALAKG